MLESIKRIVVPTDFSAASDAVIDSAAALARESDASITIAHAVQLPILHTPRDINVPAGVWGHLRETAKGEAEPVREKLREAGIATVDLALSDAHRAADLILRTVEESHADLIIMATHGRRGVANALLASVTERTLRAARIPVLTIRDRPLEFPVRQILVPIDFAARSMEACRAAAGLGGRLGARVHLLHVFSPLPESLRYASREASAWATQMESEIELRLRTAAAEVEEAGVPCTTLVRTGKVADAIVACAREIGAGMIVMGVSDRAGGLSRVLGSAARHTLQLADCPVLTVRALAGSKREPAS